MFRLWSPELWQMDFASWESGVACSMNCVEKAAPSDWIRGVYFGLFELEVGLYKVPVYNQCITCSKSHYLQHFYGVTFRQSFSMGNWKVDCVCSSNPPDSFCVFERVSSVSQNTQKHTNSSSSRPVTHVLCEVKWFVKSGGVEEICCF